MNMPDSVWSSSKHYCYWEGITCNWIRTDACFGQVVDIAVAELEVFKLSETISFAEINFPCIRSVTMDLSSLESNPSLIESLFVAFPMLSLRLDSLLCVGETW